MTGSENIPDSQILDGIRDNRLNETVYSIYRQYAEMVSLFVMKNGGSRQDGEDIFQETVITFVDLVQNNKFRGEAGIKTILVSIARNIWVNEWKKKKALDQRGKVFEIGRERVEENILSDLDQRQTKLQLMELMGKMNESCKSLLTMFYYENLSFTEIVAQTHYENEQVVRNKKYKCLKELSESIQGNSLLKILIKE